MKRVLALALITMLIPLNFAFADSAERTRIIMDGKPLNEKYFIEYETAMASLEDLAKALGLTLDLKDKIISLHPDYKNKKMLETYEKTANSYSASPDTEENKRIFKELTNYIPDYLRDFPIVLEKIDGRYLYSITKFDAQNPPAVEQGVYISFDKDMKFDEFMIKSYKEDDIFLKKISLDDGKKIAEDFAKNVLGYKSVTIKESQEVFINRIAPGKVIGFLDDRGGAYLVNLDLGRLMIYKSPAPADKI